MQNPSQIQRELSIFKKNSDSSVQMKVMNSLSFVELSTNEPSLEEALNTVLDKSQQINNKYDFDYYLIVQSLKADYYGFDLDNKPA